jgi:hypothetical protein
MAAGPEIRQATGGVANREGRTGRAAGFRIAEYRGAHVQDPAILLTIKTGEPDGGIVRPVRRRSVKPGSDMPRRMALPTLATLGRCSICGVSDAARPSGPTVAKYWPDTEHRACSSLLVTAACPHCTTTASGPPPASAPRRPQAPTPRRGTPPPPAGYLPSPGQPGGTGNGSVGNHRRGGKRVELRERRRRTAMTATDTEPTRCTRACSCSQCPPASPCLD